MRSWNGECSRAFTDWRGHHYGVGDAAWLIEDARIDYSLEESVSA
jgi:hypothetical protein